MIVLKPPLLYEGWGGHPLCLSGDSSVLMDLHWPCSCTAQSSILSISNCRSSVRHFPDDIDGLAREEEQANLVERLDNAATAYGMEISAEKTKLMTNNTSGINTAQCCR